MSPTNTIGLDCRPDDREVETDVADIRDTATPQPAERADPAQRRRVLTLDESTAAVEAAQAALDEIAERQRAEDAARAAEESERRAHPRPARVVGVRRQRRGSANRSTSTTARPRWRAARSPATGRATW